MTIQTAPTFSFCVFSALSYTDYYQSDGEKKKKSLHMYSSFSEVCISKEKIHPVPVCE